MTEHHTAGLLVLPYLRVTGANALSSPITYGFPAPSAFLGFMHALERRLSESYGIALTGVGIICHEFEPQIVPAASGRPMLFAQARTQPYLKNDVQRFVKDGTPPAIQEEGRANLQVSLVIPTREAPPVGDEDGFAAKAMHTATLLRLAGGAIAPRMPGDRPPRWIAWPKADESRAQALRQMRRLIMPGFTLVHRPDLLREQLAEERCSNPGATSLDALLTLCSVQYDYTEDAPSQAKWQARVRAGWLVPIPTGFVALTDLAPAGTVKSARDPEVPFRFVEDLLSVGEWIGAHRIQNIEQFLWRYGGDPAAGTYRITNNYASSLDPVEAGEPN